MYGYGILTFIFFMAGTALCLYGMNVYGKNRRRFGNYTESFNPNPIAKKDEIGEESLRGAMNSIIIGVNSSTLLLIAIIMKFDHFLRCTETGYTAEYIWIAPVLIIFNIFNIISSYCLIGKYNSQK